ncbi:nadh:flavin oxidoreductase nadh oxidase family protein [Lasallia pustulata]|uniref:Nadh:flavin oxidoreductase nadh oxidase family protein n=1 Tax=Lasallia pustulata TaxID=136370 RepID=A0A1W5DAZ3_9LECA|nr:nadh:flavin oxidoreductase nadh oxidase family protein [Lasallia pustulata]
MASKLFTPLQVGNSHLQHRLVMAPLTRFRADDGHVPLPMVKEYYSQRASVPGTLLTTEATLISPRASGYNNVPGIWTPSQIAAWKEITAAVHAKKSFIHLQLWALGRKAVPDIVQRDGGDFVSSSPIPMTDNSPTPRALTEDEIHHFIRDYAQAARNAIAAGFDGVEIHGANGYLIDQFTQDVINKRTDAWGGSVENRARFALEVAKAVVDAVGAERVGIRLSPFSSLQGMKMEDPYPTFSYLIRGLKDLKLAFLHLVESRVEGNADVEPTEKVNPLVDVWGQTSPVFLAGGFKPDSARRAVDEFADKDVAIVFGRYFISNPDLPYRIKEDIPLSPYDRDTFYKAKSPDGFTDYPFSKEFKAKI